MTTEFDINSTYFNLNIKKIIGTSAKNSQQFAVQDNLIAYTASGGVVVSTIDEATTEVTSQRFFCANVSSKIDISDKNNSTSSANAYLNMIKSDPVEDPKKDTYGYPINSNPIEVFSSLSDYQDDNSANCTSPSKLKDKVRSINCIAISPNKKLLAIGEIGYQPRILIFSLAENSSDNPIWLIYEHLFGINSLVFSPDSRHLCSLGLVNDGLLNVWRISNPPNTISLVASNRCSNIVHRVLWHENLIVTLGLRFIKLWKFVEDDVTITKKAQILKGKNVILGNLISGNFIDASIFNDDEILVISNSSQLLLLKLNFEAPKIISLKTPDFEFGSIVTDHLGEHIWFGSTNYNIESCPFEELASGNSPAPTISRNIAGFSASVSKDSAISRPIIRVYNFSESHLVYLNDCEEIKFVDKKTQTSNVLTTSLLKNLGGIKHASSGEFLAFSKDGVVKTINKEIELEDLIEFTIPNNEVIANSVSAVEKNGDLLMIGDKYGTLSILEITTDRQYNLRHQSKAHSSSINEIAYFEFEKYQIICSISRDRMIQVFTNIKGERNWDLLQTLPIHNGNLTHIVQYGNQIYVCSTDRTLSIHNFVLEDDKLRIYQEKVLTLKSTPLCMKRFDQNLVVSTNDKSILVFDIENNFDLKKTLKLATDKTGESLLVESFIKYRHLMVVWSGDKSLRAFQFSNGKEIGVAWGHSESLMQLYLFQDNELISIGNDGCLFSWEIIENLKSSSSSVISQPEEQTNENVPSPPLYTKVTRKILPTVPIKSVESKPEKPVSAIPTPTPKLTTATLKRIEAKKNNEGGMISRSTSPIRPTSNHYTAASAPVKSSIRSPTKPLKIATTPKRLDSPLKIEPSKIKPHVFLNSPTSPIKSATFRKEEKSLVEMALSKLDEVAETMNKCNDEEKVLIKGRIDQLFYNKEVENQLLEKYSDKLVELVQQKLQLSAKNESEN
ncbi:hypothetical protein G210_3247 [Candida maltosa Xu316]|uniref:WD40 repeat-like protein n=1 Tax=Candida maltosa (strain Xu316) TaxID=1245528 RepID=M3JUF4_CANMX|nr:hypothetical protein G210_3247 [Candida maltosa Xu316]